MTKEKNKNIVHQTKDKETDELSRVCSELNCLPVITLK